MEERTFNLFDIYLSNEKPPVLIHLHLISLSPNSPPPKWEGSLYLREIP